MLDNILLLLTKYGRLFFEGTLNTLMFSAITVFFGAIIGAVVCLMKMSRHWFINIIPKAYIEIIRGTPLLLQLYFFYFLLPKMTGIDMSTSVSIGIALVVNSAAYVAEIFRSGIQNVDIGQTEAARSLGLTGTQTMLRIVLPQAIKSILPSLANEFIMVIKETSLASTFFLGELMTQYKTISGALFMIIEPLIIIGVIYFVLTFTLSKIVAAFERRMGASD